jgi:hypothetical protein
VKKTPGRVGIDSVGGGNLEGYCILVWVMLGLYIANPQENFLRRSYCGVWPIKCRQGSKTNKSNSQFWKKLKFDWLLENPSQYLCDQRPSNTAIAKKK